MGKKQQWPTVAPPRRTMKCETHGDEAKVRRVPDHYSPESITTLEGDRWGCDECVKVVGEKIEAIERERRAEKERAAEEKRAEKRRLLEVAREAEQKLREAVEDFDRVIGLPSKAELQRRLEDVQHKLDAARQKLRAAQEKVDRHETTAAEIKEAIGDSDQNRDEVRERLVQTSGAVDAAWQDVPRIKREKHRDKTLRARARKAIG